jgi:alcohol dehydrogenase class IV
VAGSDTTSGARRCLDRGILARGRSGNRDPPAHLQAATPVRTHDHDLARTFISLMRATGLPSGIAALGYTEEDMRALAEGAFAQQRPLVMAPRGVSKQDLEGLYRNALRYW